MNIVIFFAIVSRLFLANGDVGFNDSSPYLVTSLSPDMSSVRFSLSEKTSQFKDLMFNEQDWFSVDTLEALISSTDLASDLKEELYDALNGSFMSRHTSKEFLSALQHVLDRYKTSKKAAHKNC